jgi:small subunit ribosomal protein S2
MAVVTMRQLLESGVHFGHQTRRWNPKMKRFIMTERNGIYIIDLQQSLAYIDRSYAFIKDTVAKGGTIMFVGTKKQAQEAIAEQATRVGMPYVNQRWLGGMLTNFQTVHQRINRLKELDEIDFDDVAGSSRTKKELLQMRRERDKLNKSLGGIREMGRTPSAVWIVDTNKEHLAVEEARKLHIPIIGILDSNCDPDLVDFPIPGNDDAIRAVGLLTRVVADAVAEGLIARSGAKTEGAEAGAEEPLAEWERELLGGEAEQAATAATGDAAAEAPAEAPAAEGTGAAVEATDVAEVASEVAEATDVAEAPAAEATEAPLEEPIATDAVITEAADETETPTPEAARVEVEAATTAPASVETEAVVSTAEDSSTDDGAYGPDSAAPLADGSAPDGFEIKGNQNSMKFHAPSSPWYARTNAEVWFRTAEAAAAAGFANAESGDASESGDAGDSAAAETAEA